VPGFVHYKKGCTQFPATNDKVYQLLADDRWFSPGLPASSKSGRHDIAEILLKVALNTNNQIKSNQIIPSLHIQSNLSINQSINQSISQSINQSKPQIIVIKN
jgi:hypothetical protein